MIIYLLTSTRKRSLRFCNLVLALGGGLFVVCLTTTLDAEVPPPPAHSILSQGDGGFGALGGGNTYNILYIYIQQPSHQNKKSTTTIGDACNRDMHSYSPNTI